LVAGNAIQRNYYSTFTHYFVVNLENGEYGYDGGFAGSVNNFSNGNEGAVAGMLWDLYDNADDDYTQWSGSPGVGMPDGIGDNYDNGLSNILNCLTVRNYTSHHPLNINEFWDVWFQSPSLGSPYEVWAIWKEHGANMDNTPPTGSLVINNGASITASLSVTLALSATDNMSGMTPPLGKMRFSNNNSVWSTWESYAATKTNWNLSFFGGDTMRTTKTTYVQFKDAAGNQSASFSDNIIFRDYICGDANHDGMVNVGDAVYVINYVFKGGPAPQPLEAGDANCDHAVNTGDAVYVINYVFKKNGPAPCCP